METLSIPPQEIARFILVFFRMLGIFISIPVMGGPQVPGRVKVLFGFVTAAVLHHSIAAPVVSLNIFVLSGGILREMFIGILFGFAGKLMFGAIELAGGLIGFQMGLMMSNVIDPQTNSQISSISQFQVVLASLVFLSMNMHHVFIMAALKSFVILPLMAARFNGELVDFMVKQGGAMFVTAMQIASPVSAALIVTNAILALISRAVPRMNVFMVGFPLTVAVGLLGIGLTLPYFMYFLKTRLFAQLGANLEMLLMLLQ